MVASSVVDTGIAVYVFFPQNSENTGRLNIEASRYTRTAGSKGQRMNNIAVLNESSQGRHLPYEITLLPATT